jgi:hypothetical protein
VRLFQYLDFKPGLLMLALSILASGSAFAQSCPTGTLPVYRFFNTVTTGHFFTMIEAEKATVQATLPNFRFEGVGFCASAPVAAPPSTGLTPGRWTGPNIQFFVNSSGTAITSDGSPIGGNTNTGIPTAIQFTHPGTNGCTLPIITYGTSGIVISGGLFSVTGNFVGGPTLKIDGHFTSQTQANGTYSISGNANCPSVANGTWSATATGSVSDSAESTSAK